MFLKTSFSTTKKLFQKTLNGVKSFFSTGYQKLPKSPPCSPLFSCSGSGFHTQNELDKIYTSLSTHWECENDKSKKKIASPPTNNSRHQDKLVHDQKIVRFMSPRKSNYQVLEKEAEDDHLVREKRVNFGPNPTKSNKKITYQGKKKQYYYSSSNREERSHLVAQKLKELKMMEKSNEEHALDIEEVLHYYSRLTCPPYVEIIDKFFMEMYSELFNHQPSSN